MRTKGNGRSGDAATERVDTVRGAASRAEQAARHLLGRTRLLARHASRKLSPSQAPVSDAPAALSILPQAQIDAATSARTSGPDDEAARQLVLLRVRVERAEQAAAWLRARLRAERARHRTTMSVDVVALTSHLTTELARLRAPARDVVERVVERALAAQGLPVTMRDDGARTGGRTRGTGGRVPVPDAGRRGDGRGTAPGDSRARAQTRNGRPPALPGWTGEQQEAVARQVLARTPEVADHFYVYHTLEVVSGRGRVTQQDILRHAGLDSAMARRRLRLAVDTLAALGALSLRDGVYTLTMEFQPQSAPGRAAGGPSQRHVNAPRPGRDRGRVR